MYFFSSFYLFFFVFLHLFLQLFTPLKREVFQYFLFNFVQKVNQSDTKGMHIGNYLKDRIKKERYSLRQIGDMINKSAEGVKKDLEKDKVSMSVLESYADALEVNLYALLAEDWKKTHNLSEEDITIAAESITQEYNRKVQKHPDEEVTVTISLKGKKKERILKILFEES